MSDLGTTTMISAPSPEHVLALAIFHAMRGDTSMIERLEHEARARPPRLPRRLQVTSSHQLRALAAIVEKLDRPDRDVDFLLFVEFAEPDVVNHWSPDDDRNRYTLDRGCVERAVERLRPGALTSVVAGGGGHTARVGDLVGVAFGDGSAARALAAALLWSLAQEPTRGSQ